MGSLLGTSFRRSFMGRTTSAHSPRTLNRLDSSSSGGCCPISCAAQPRNRFCMQCQVVPSACVVHVVELLLASEAEWRCCMSWCAGQLSPGAQADLEAEADAEATEE